MSANSFVHLLQFADGLFPAGGYAHSFGLETCVQSGRVSSADDVAMFLRAHLEGSAAPTDAVVALCAARAAAGNPSDVGAIVRLDQMLDALKPAAELREASRQMGRQTLRVLKELSRDELVGRFAVALEEGATRGHHAVVFGLAGAALQWAPEEMAAAFLYSTSALIAGAALRLMPLGQLAGQRILWSVGPLIATLSHEVQTRSEEDIWSFAPEIEIAAMRHESLEARLFRS